VNNRVLVIPIPSHGIVDWGSSRSTSPHPIYFLVAYSGVHRTGLIRTGCLVAAASSFVGCIVLFTAAAIVTPGLALALFANPPLLLILSVFALVPLAYSILVGLLSGAVARYVAPPAHPSVALPPS
jgi:hypothetical protein